MNFIYTIDDDEPIINSSDDEKKIKLHKGFMFDAMDDQSDFLDRANCWGFEGVKSAVKQRGFKSTSVEDKIGQLKSREFVDDDEKEVIFEDDDDDGKEEEESLVDEEENVDDTEDEFENEENEKNEKVEDESDDDEIEIDDEDEDENEIDDERKNQYFEKAEIKTIEFGSFKDLSLSRPIVRALTAMQYSHPTAIQMNTIPVAMTGKDICASAVTGSGKTAAFLIPIMERLMYRTKAVVSTRVLILLPTRELAAQCFSVAQKISQFTDITIGLAVGGLSLKLQEAELRKRPDIVIATPGRLIDLILNTASFSLDGIEILVLDEADRMLEVGFKNELSEIITHCPRNRQTMLFSATMTDNVDDLIRLSLNHPVKLFVDTNKSMANNLIQEFVRIRKQHEKDRPAFLLALCKKVYKHRCIVFVASKAMAHRLCITFGLMGLKAAELHGSLTQAQRIEALEKFRDSHVDFLLCTDLAARGLDIAGVQTVINFNMPTDYTRYTHRVGRTARAGLSGKAVSLVGEDDRKLAKEVMKHSSSKTTLVRRNIPLNIISKFSKFYSDCEDNIRTILEQEKEEKLIEETEIQVERAENLLKHHDEIQSRPKRVWFQSEGDKKEEEKKPKSLSSVPERSKLDGKSRKRKRNLMSKEEIEKGFNEQKKVKHSSKNSTEQVIKKKKTSEKTKEKVKPARNAVRNSTPKGKTGKKLAKNAFKSKKKHKRR